MTEYRDIRYTVKDGIAEVLLCRPGRMNAFTINMKNELVDVIGRIDRGETGFHRLQHQPGRGFLLPCRAVHK